MRVLAGEVDKSVVKTSPVGKMKVRLNRDDEILEMFDRSGLNQNRSLRVVFDEVKEGEPGKEVEKEVTVRRR